MRFGLLSSVLIIICMQSVYAEIYTCKDANGKTTYTDSPAGCANAEEVEVDSLPALITTKPLTNRPTINSSSKKQEDKNPYSALKITSPANDSAVRDNQGNVTINFQATPSLQTRSGDQYVVMMDGIEIYRGTSNIASLKNVDRGTHTINVKIVGSDGKAKITATPVSFTLQRYSALQSSANSQNNSTNNVSPANQSALQFPGRTNIPTRPTAAN